MAEKERDVLYRIDGKGVILKIKQALEIGKMLFCFVQYDTATNKAVATIDCYMDAEYFGAMLIKKILGEAPYQGRSLLRDLANEKQKSEKQGKQYPGVVWTSPLGGKKTESGAVSRSFTISPGSRSEVLFTANEYEAEESSTGAFVAKKGTKPVATIRVPAKYDDLIVLSYNWSWLETDFMSRKFSLENMKSEYRANQQRTLEPETATPETTAPEPVASETKKAAASGRQNPKDAKQLAVRSCHELSYLEKSKIYVLQVITSDGTKHAVYVNKSAMNSEKWPEFQRKAAVSGFNFIGLFLEKNPAKGDFELIGFPA